MMKRIIKKIISTFLISIAFAYTTYAQDTAIITATSVAACPGSVVVPINGQNIVNAGSMSLGLIYDTEYLTYTGYQSQNPALTGFFLANDNGGEVRVSWFTWGAGVNLSNSTLVEFIFTYKKCVGNMIWNLQPGICQLTTPNNQIIPAIFVDGQVTSSAITSQPPDIAVTENQNALFSLTAPGATSYQWQESVDSVTWTNLTNTGVYSGVNEPTLVLTGVPLSMNGYQYRAYVSGGSCSDTSCSAFLFVTATQPILTTIGVDSACSTAIAMPVDVEEFYLVGSFSLKLDYDMTKVSYSSYQNMNTALSTGTLNITAVGGQVAIDWSSSPTAVNLGSATLFELIFVPVPGVTGQSALTWDTIPAGNCKYQEIGGAIIPSYYANGSLKMNSRPTPIISGNNSVCAYQSGQVYTTPLVSGNTYNWTVTGGTIQFGNLNSITVKWGDTGIGTVSVVETNPVTGCDSTTADYLVTINPNPVAFNVTGGGGYCSGGNGSEIGLSGSETDVNYQLRLLTSNIGSPVSGTGSPISFGNHTAAGSYSVRATSINGCILSMTGVVQVTVNPLPYKANVTGGGTMCSGGGGFSVGIDTSQFGVNYQMLIDGTPSGTPLPGTNAPMSFGVQYITGVYTVVATNTTTLCSDTMAGSATIILSDPPTADAGPDASICQGNTFTLNGNATNYSVVAWTTTGDGTFINGNTLTPTYTPGPNDIINGTVTLGLIAFGIGTCPDANDQMQLTINLAPSVNAGPDDYSCPNLPYQINGASNNYDHVLWNGGDGVFNDNTILNPTYTPGPGDIANDSVILNLTVYGFYPCDTLEDYMILYFLPGSSADAGADATICESNSHNLNGMATNYDSISWSGGDGYFSDPKILNPSYTPGANDIAGGSVWITLTAHGPCGDVSDFMVLSITNLPTADAGAEASICAGQTYPLSGSATNYSSVLWTKSGDGQFLNASSLNAIYIPGPNDRLNGFVT